MNKINKIILWEQGRLNEEETNKLFQELIDDGTVWYLQGSYGRMAKALIAEGKCHPQKLL